jgi:dihydroneopterin aldolase
MITISIYGAEFFAHHGFYPEEQILGNKFVVDIEVGFARISSPQEDKLTNTLDYQQLYQIADVQMKQTRKLIETVAQAIIDDIKTQFPFAENIRVAIKKLNPPLKGKVNYSGVVLSEP